MMAAADTASRAGRPKFSTQIPVPRPLCAGQTIWSKGPYAALCRRFLATNVSWPQVSDVAPDTPDASSDRGRNSSGPVVPRSSSSSRPIDAAVLATLTPVEKAIPPHLFARFLAHRRPAGYGHTPRSNTGIHTTSVKTSRPSSLSRPAHYRWHNSKSVCRPLQLLPGPEEISAQATIEMQPPAKAAFTGNYEADCLSVPMGPVDAVMFATLSPVEKAIPPHLFERFLAHRRPAGNGHTPRSNIVIHTASAKTSPTSAPSSLSRPAHYRRRNSKSVCQPLQLLPGPEEISAQATIEMQPPAKAAFTGNYEADCLSVPMGPVDAVMFATLSPVEKAIPPHLFARFLAHGCSARHGHHTTEQSSSHPSTNGTPTASAKTSVTSPHGSHSEPAQHRRRNCKTVSRQLQICPVAEPMSSQATIETHRPTPAAAKGTCNHDDFMCTPTRQVDPVMFATLSPSQKAIPPNLLARFLNRRMSDRRERSNTKQEPAEANTAHRARTVRNVVTTPTQRNPSRIPIPMGKPCHSQHRRYSARRVYTMSASSLHRLKHFHLGPVRSDSIPSKIPVAIQKRQDR
jgi:hypothetical protein